MKVFIFDLLAYGEHLDRFMVNGSLPRPLGRAHFDPQVMHRTYAEHLAAWAEMERMAFDGVAINEHHGTPYGTMNSPNLLAAAVSQRTERLKILIYGNLLPLHEPLRLAEELAMLDCLSNGRLIAGVARGAPREYRFYNVPMAESRARFEECFEIMKRAWTEDSFSYEGKFHTYRNVSIWPKPLQQPHPPVWLPVTGSKDSIEWAAENDVPITPGLGRLSGPMGWAAREDIIRHYALCLAKRNKPITPAHLNLPIDCYVADSKAQAIEEYGPYNLYFQNALFSYDHVTQEEMERGYYSPTALDYLRSDAKTIVHSDALFSAGLTMEEVARRAENLAWGSPDEVVDRIIEEAEHAGAETVLVACNRGAMPQEMFLNQIRRLGKEVLPRIQAHKITRVKLAEGLGP